MDPDIPTPEQIAAELHRLIRRRSGPPVFDAEGVLLALDCVRDRATSDAAHAREAALAQILAQVAATLGDPARSRAAIVLLSLEGRLLRADLTKRRQAAADELCVGEADSFRRRHERPLVEDLARTLVSTEVAHRLRCRPAGSAPDVGWVERFEAYYRIYAPLAGLRGDLEILIRAQREKPGEFDYLIAPIGASLGFYAQYLLATERLVEDFGGLWLLSDVEAETDVANAVQQLNAITVINEHDASWLRIKLRQTPDHELDPFLERISAEARGEAIIHAWADWCQTCQCPNLLAPDRTCEVHAVMEAGRSYGKVMDSEARGVLDPERQRLRAIPSEDIREIIKRFGVVRPGSE